jgi:hypothetical protein
LYFKILTHATHPPPAGEAGAAGGQSFSRNHSHRPEAVRKSPFAGALFEGFIAAEIVKSQVNDGRRRELYYFRDEQGLEVDFVIPGRQGSLMLVEAKLTRTVNPSMAAPMLRLAQAAKKEGPYRRRVAMSLVHEAPASGVVTRALAPGVRALSWREFLGEL